jgi:small subunit ribosomal protein S1
VPVAQAEASRDRMRALMQDDYAYAPPRRGEIREAYILSIEDERMIVDLPQTKRDGVVTSRDLELLDSSYRASLHVGDCVPVCILRSSDRSGYVVVSIKQGLSRQDWLRAEQLARSRQVVEAEVTGFNRGGVVISFGHLRGFVPNSHLGMPFRRTHEAKADLVGKTLSLVVLEVEQRRRSLILSAREAQQMRRKQLLEELQAGQIRTGIVDGLVSYGAFVDLGGLTGLIHISELDWSYVRHPSEVLQVGDELEVLILSVDRERQRVSLSRKGLLPPPQTPPVPDAEEWGILERAGTAVHLPDWVQLQMSAPSAVDA